MPGKDAELKKSIVCIQNFLKTRVTRRHVEMFSFADYALPESQQTNYPALFAGNGPLNIEIPVDKQVGKPFLLVGVSCFYMLKLAVNLCAKGQFDLLKKIIVLDNSKNVVSFWRYMQQTLYVSSDFTAFKTLLQDDEASWSSLCSTDNNKTYVGTIPFEAGYEPFIYSSKRYNVYQCYALIDWLCERVGFERLKSWVMDAMIIPCDWRDKNNMIFNRVDEFAKQHGYEVAVYSSNIVSFVDQYDTDKHEDFEQVFFTIKQLNPIVSLYLDVKFGLTELFGGISGNVFMPSKLLCFSGAGAKDRLLELTGWHAAKEIYNKNTEARKQVVSCFIGAIGQLKQKNYPVMLNLAKEAYESFEKICADECLIDRYVKDYLLGRVLGLAHIKNGDMVPGKSFLEQSANYLGSLYGNSDAVKKYKAEVSGLCQSANYRVTA